MTTRWTMVLAVFFALIGMVAPSHAQSEFGLELTGSTTTVADDSRSTFGFWRPSDHESWDATAKEDFRFAGGRLIYPSKGITVFIGFEDNPSLISAGSRLDGDGQSYATTVTLDTEVWELGLSRSYGIPGRYVLSPWAGVAHMRLREKRLTEGLDQAETAKSLLWGVSVGSDLGVSIAARFAVTARGLVRWTTGDRKSTQLVDETAFGLPDPAYAEFKDSVNRAMWGADLGLRWQALEEINVEAGYRIRDWTNDGGPASFRGPYVRLLASF